MKKNYFKMFLFFYYLIYLLLIAVASGVFYIFQPFTYIDNNKSYLICEKGNSYVVGPNLVYAFSGNLDSFNDKKARKVCEYGVIRDYEDTFKTPSEMNYKFYPVLSEESSWPQSLFAFFITLVSGMIIIEFIVLTFSSLIFKKSQTSNRLLGKRLLIFITNLIYK